MAPTRCNPSLQIFANGTWTSLTLLPAARTLFERTGEVTVLRDGYGFPMGLQIKLLVT